MRKAGTTESAVRSICGKDHLSLVGAQAWILATLEDGDRADFERACRAVEARAAEIAPDGEPSAWEGRHRAKVADRLAKATARVWRDLNKDRVYAELRAEIVRATERAAATLGMDVHDVSALALARAALRAPLP